ncbi:MAG TPA: DUF4097 family beta strand repeat-containing protein [Acidimicrobiia bacterium]|nr:DUF4097 family beta strand repeat-containing protein [Acidimicrobiia bacterium]
MTVFDTPEPISVTIELAVGDVHLIAGERKDTVVVVNPSNRSRRVDVEAAEQTQVKLTPGRLLVRAPKARGLSTYIGLGRYGSVEITLELPEGSHVEATGGLADFRADGRLGDTRIKDGAGDVLLDETGRLDVATGAGRVTVDKVTGHAELTTAGEMRIGLIDGDAEIKNQSGKTRVGEVTGRLQVKSSNGDIVVDRAHADVAAKTANGSIEIGEIANGSVTLETSMGSLDIGIRTGTAAWVDARTRFGRVHNSLESAAAPESSQQAVEISARTSFGDIVIHRS